MNKLKNSKILYIEDDQITQENISSYLQRKCKKLYIASDGREGLELFKKYKPHIIITDIEMPNLDGLSMAKEIRRESNSTQIIITTAYTSNEYLIEAVNLHLIKYLIKPISLPKLNEALANCEEFLKDSVITKIDLNTNTFYDTFTKELIKDKKIVSLSKTERALLDLLIKNHPAPTSYEAIDSNVYEFASSKNAIKLLVKALRNKIGKEAISNVSGFGYNVNIIKER